MFTRTKLIENKINEKFKIFCIFRNNGCMKILFPNDIGQHEALCEYRVYFDPRCNHNVIFSMRNMHDEKCQLFPVQCNICFA